MAMATCMHREEEIMTSTFVIEAGYNKLVPVASRHGSGVHACIGAAAGAGAHVGASQRDAALLLSQW
jgi:hypothetical protein